MLPVCHVGGGEEAPFEHVVGGGVVFVVAGEDVDAVVVDYWGWVGCVDVLDDGVFGACEVYIMTV